MKCHPERYCWGMCKIYGIRFVLIAEAAPNFWSKQFILHQISLCLCIPKMNRKMQLSLLFGCVHWKPSEPAIRSMNSIKRQNQKKTVAFAFFSFFHDECWHYTSEVTWSVELLCGIMTWNNVLTCQTEVQPLKTYQRKKRYKI